MRLKVFRKTAATYLTVGHSAVEPLTSAGLKTFATQITVQGGDLLGIRVGGGQTRCRAGGVTGDLTRSSAFAEPDPLIGDPAVFAFDEASKLNVAAAVEPDADGDGFGDQTQDQCPTDASAHEACPLDTASPETTITKGAPNKTDKAKVKFRFTSDDPDSTFECKLDKRAFKPCTSPKKVKRLDQGKHKFKVRAIDAAGNVDPSPAKDKFKVVG